MKRLFILNKMKKIYQQISRVQQQQAVNIFLQSSDNILFQIQQKDKLLLNSSQQRTMKPYNPENPNLPNQYQGSHYQNTNPVQEPTNNQKKPFLPQQQTHKNVPSIKNYFISLGLFTIAFAIYIGVWVIQKFAVNHQIASHYYQKNYNWASAMPASYRAKVPANQKSIALELILQWIMWKAPLLLFTYNCISLKEGAIKWISLGLVAGVCLAADVLLTIFALNVYNNMMYFGLFSLMTVLVAIINNSSLNRVKQAVFDSLFPLLSVAVLYAIQNLALPILYKLYLNNLAVEAALFLIFYTFPFIDLIMYAIILFLGNYISKEVRTFYQRVHYLLIGYEVGFIMLVGYTQVQFYYLCAYLIFRNVFSNWVMWRWDNVVKLPPLLPGWIAPYYFSYALLFIPFGGIGNIATSVGYYSLILVNTSPLLYALPSSLYPYDTYTSSGVLTNFDMNILFKGRVYWIAGLVIWFATTFSQRYSKKRPQILNSIISNLWGIYLFYLGISSGICANSLTTYSLIS